MPLGDTAERLALRDLTLLDGALARLAAALQMDVQDHDTISAAEGADDRHAVIPARDIQPAER